MATNEYNFKSIAESEYLEEVPETATVLVEDNGSIKRVPGSGLGGGGGNVVVIRQTNLDEIFYAMDNGVTNEPEVSSDSFPFEITNITFEEACDILRSGQQLVFNLLYSSVGSDGIPYLIDENSMGFELYTLGDGILCMRIQSFKGFDMYWSADGLSFDEPENPNAGPV